ncbi:type II toxin-antitoxin system HipA family toxin [Leptospira ilyithenensis]|uniref:Type II toxin-antitoxin system HipA family toxin n=1 Tax=Leptospira ilyithenensis TaxID=2484901 RepID=A0A4R9LX89_9LEPT|nr:type II toxin-antitoxin system HipA family toxin [Leptospira ilyithenensis]TGN14319.1 type II toxin-antitoxin system HipA family toxin [Leptospira ilyithenensis]
MEQPVAVNLWGERVGGLVWDKNRGLALFEYDPEFIRSRRYEISPLLLPLSSRVFQYPELKDTKTFKGLPGVIADSLPEKFGNRLLDAYLAKHGRKLEDMNPLERLCYVGTRGMGALEYEPDLETRNLNKPIPIQVSDLVEVAKGVLNEHKSANASLVNDGIDALIAVGTSAGGAKAKAIIAINSQTKDVLSGQANVPKDYEHWLIKFDEMENEEHATGTQIGRIEFAYSEMAYESGINMMECQLLKDGKKAHFMTKRFDRVNGNDKVHVLTFAGMIHADRDPPGSYGYERLFQTIREMGLGQDTLNEMYRRMVFNICSRNQDDHTKNHAFLMFGDGNWQLSPAYDLCFSYKPGNQFIEQHQMSCNGKREHFMLEDLLEAAKFADIKRPRIIIEAVEEAVCKWPDFAEKAGIQEKNAAQIGNLHRRFIKK